MQFQQIDLPAAASPMRKVAVLWTSNTGTGASLYYTQEEALQDTLQKLAQGAPAEVLQNLPADTQEALDAVIRAYCAAGGSFSYSIKIRP